MIFEHVVCLNTNATKMQFGGVMYGLTDTIELGNIFVLWIYCGCGLIGSVGHVNVLVIPLL